MSPLRLAAIDIGSNAARLLIVEVAHDSEGKPLFNKLNLVRVPLRLGFDVFDKGEISREKRGMVLQTMKAYNHLINAYGVKHVIACATSAMRDAGNSADLIRKIRLETGLQIDENQDISILTINQWIGLIRVVKSVTCNLAQFSKVACARRRVDDLDFGGLAVDDEWQLIYQRPNDTLNA